MSETTINDLMPTIGETITPEIEAQIEFQAWQRLREEEEAAREYCAYMRELNHDSAERWESHEAKDGPLFTPREWGEHCADYEHYLTYGVSPMAEAAASAEEDEFFRLSAAIK